MAMSHRLEPGEIFEQRYRVTKSIGAGGFAVVYLAKQLDLDRDVALKVLRPSDNDEDPDDDYGDKIVGRFEREAKLVSQLRDPNTITMYDYGQSEVGHLYMVFEFVDGISLKQLLKREKKLSAERTVKIMRQVLMSLQEAHSVGVLHRDLKPANVMVFDQVGRQDQIKVLDFGIATRAFLDKKDLTKNLTEEGMILGTPRYMSPEQIRGKELALSSDLYSVGLLGFEMLVGRSAILGENSIEVIGQQIAPEPAKIPMGVELPGNLRRVLKKLLQKDPALRFEDAGEVIEALANWDGGPDVQMLTDDESVPDLDAEFLEPVDGDGASESTPWPTTATMALPRRRRRLLIVAVVLGVLFSGAGVFFMTRDGQDDPPFTEPAEAGATSDSTPDKPSGGDPSTAESLGDQVVETAGVEQQSDGSAELIDDPDQPVEPREESESVPGSTGEAKTASQPAPPENPVSKRPPVDPSPQPAPAPKPEPDDRPPEPDEPPGDGDDDDGDEPDKSPFWTLD
jgi:serine/threonine-protein kinase